MIINFQFEIEDLEDRLNQARKKYCKENNKTVRDITTSLGCDRSFFYQIESKNNQAVSIDHILKLEELYGEKFLPSLDELLKSDHSKKIRKTMLYYVKFFVGDSVFYKIGITHHSVKRRFYGEKAPYEIINETWYDTAKEAEDAEHKILIEHGEFVYRGEPVLSSKGNTELFVIDVLGLDQKVETPTST